MRPPGDGDGTYTQSSEFGGSSTFALVWADYDNDGDRLFVNNGDRTFSQELQFGAGRTIALAWVDTATATSSSP